MCKPRGCQESYRAIRVFCEHSSIAATWKKCLGLSHDEGPSTPTVFDRVVWSNTPARNLGVPLEQYLENNEYGAIKLENMSAKTKKWEVKGFSILAPTTVCNAFLAAKVWACCRYYIARGSTFSAYTVFSPFLSRALFGSERDEQTSFVGSKLEVLVCRICLFNRFTSIEARKTHF